MAVFRDWEFCSKTTCLERGRLEFAAQSASVHDCMKRFRSDPVRIREFRDLLSRMRPGDSSPTLLSDGEVCDRVTEMLARAQLHVHYRPLRRAMGRGSTAGVAGAERPTFPLSDRRPRSEANDLTSAFAEDPPTFADFVDPQAQLDAFQSASKLARALVPQ